MNVNPENDLIKIDDKFNQVWDYMSMTKHKKSDIIKMIDSVFNYIINMDANKKYKIMLEELYKDYNKLLNKNELIIRYYMYAHSQIKLSIVIEKLNDVEYNKIINILYNNKKYILNLEFNKLNKNILNILHYYDKDKFMSYRDYLIDAIKLIDMYNSKNIELPIQPRIGE